MAERGTEIVIRRLPRLRELTPARVALPIAGNSIATSEVLDFQLAHARARDAVHAALDLQGLLRQLKAEWPDLPVISLRTEARTRAMYLRQPPLGRRLDAESEARLPHGDFDLAMVLADGLSAAAVEQQAVPLLRRLVPALNEEGWRLAPLTVVEQGRVAVGDAIGAKLGARCSLVLLGERPGLSTPCSLGAYVTWAPGAGRTDADRNCLSNIHETGLSHEAAASRLLWLLRAARAQQQTGVALKEGATAALPGS